MSVSPAPSTLTWSGTIISTIGVLSMSCKSRAESFARRLQTRLWPPGRGLDQQNSNFNTADNDETPCCADGECNVTDEMAPTNAVSKVSTIDRLSSNDNFEKDASPISAETEHELVREFSSTCVLNGRESDLIHPPKVTDAAAAVPPCGEDDGAKNDDLDPVNGEANNNLENNSECSDHVTEGEVGENDLNPGCERAMLTYDLTQGRELSDIQSSDVQRETNEARRAENKLLNCSECISPGSSPTRIARTPFALPKRNACNDDDDEEDDPCPKRVTRCSSLKTFKSPPGTPCKKKIVRFADALGLDLEAVKTVFLDDLPVVPPSAFTDLDENVRSTGNEIAPTNPQIYGTEPRSFVSTFTPPAGAADIINLIRKNKVCVESVGATYDGTINGIVRVLNLDFHKSVHVRYSIDNWQNCYDVEACYVPCSSDAFSDRFSFTLYGNSLKIGEKISFAVVYRTLGQEFWDNNGGLNYSFVCCAQQPTPADEVLFNPKLVDDHAWIHFV